MIFIITEIDRDYNAFVSDVVMEFKDSKEANDYCKSQTWAGAYYFYTELNKKYG